MHRGRLIGVLTAPIIPRGREPSSRKSFDHGDVSFEFLTFAVKGRHSRAPHCEGRTIKGDYVDSVFATETEDVVTHLRGDDLATGRPYVGHKAHCACVLGREGGAAG